MKPEIKIELSPQDVKEAIADYVNRKMQLVQNQNVKPNHVHLNVSFRSPSPNGRLEYPTFDNATVTIIPNSVSGDSFKPGTK